MGDDVDTEVPPRKKCPDCAELVAAEARICRYCRHRFDANEDAAAPVEPEPREAPVAGPTEAAPAPADDSHPRLVVERRALWKSVPGAAVIIGLLIALIGSMVPLHSHFKYEFDDEFLTLGIIPGFLMTAIPAALLYWAMAHRNRWIRNLIPAAAVLFALAWVFGGLTGFRQATLCSTLHDSDREMERCYDEVREAFNEDDYEVEEDFLGTHIIARGITGPGAYTLAAGFLVFGAGVAWFWTTARGKQTAPSTSDSQS